MDTINSNNSVAKTAKAIKYQKINIRMITVSFLLLRPAVAVVVTVVIAKGP